MFRLKIIVHDSIKPSLNRQESLMNFTVVDEIAIIKFTNIDEALDLY